MNEKQALTDPRSGITSVAGSTVTPNRRWYQPAIASLKSLFE